MGGSEQQQTNPMLHINILHESEEDSLPQTKHVLTLPDAEEIRLTKTSKGYHLQIYFPTPRYYQCTAHCNRYFCNSYTKTPSPKAEADSRVEIIKHLKKLHKIE